ncbi:hypothetical protein ACHAXR_013048 [Thalassiosira sp. AJA248-18]
MVLTPPPLLLVAAMAAAAPSALMLIPTAQALQLMPSPPSHPPNKSSRRGSATTSKTPRPANRGGVVGGMGFGSRQQSSSSTTPLRAYTVADNKNSNNPWLNFPTSFADFGWKFGAAEDSLFSFEGGNALQAATRPAMPNLEVEAETISSLQGKDELLSGLNALTATFDDLQSSMDYKSQLYSETIKSYEYKVESLEEKNTLLEEGLQAMTVTLERQEHQIQGLQQEKEDTAAKEEQIVNDDNIFLLQVQELENENEMFRQRVRVLEVELSDIAFESRTRVIPAPPAAAAVTPPVTAEITTHSSVEAVPAAKLSPKAPSVPVPPHIYQQRQFEQLQLQVEQYKRERSSVRKLFGLGIRRGMNKLGKTLNLWSPLYNLQKWGELRGQGQVVM